MSVSGSRALLWGEGRLSGGSGAPALWRSANVASDGGTAWALLARTRPVAPAGFGGECRFVWAHLVVTHSMGATLRVTPLVDADAMIGTPSSTVTPLGTVSPVSTLVTLAQQAAPYARRTQTLTIPLLQRLVDGAGVEQTRQSIRGAECALLIESVGALGTGELLLDGAELEFELLRRASFSTITTA